MADTKTVAKAGDDKLTHRQEQLVEAVVHGDHSSVAQAAAAVKMDPGNANRMTRYDAVGSAIAKAKRERSDKARGLVGNFASIVTKLTRRLERHADDENLSPAETAGLLKVVTDAGSKLEQLQQQLGLHGRDEAREYAEGQARLRRAMRIGIALGQGRTQLGLHLTTEDAP